MRTLVMMSVVVCTIICLMCDERASAVEVPPMPPLKAFYTEIPITHNGAPACLIAVPDGAEYAELGAKVAEAIQRASSAVVPVRSAAKLPISTLETSNAILLGYFANNPLIGRLYDEYFVNLDAQWPGKGGYIIRTVHDPMGKGTGFVCLGGADVESVSKAVDDFISTLPGQGDISYPHTVKVVLPNGTLPYKPAPEKIAERIAAAEGKNFRAASGLLGAASYAYYRTGNPDELEVFKGIVPHVMQAGRSLGEIGDMIGATDIFNSWDAIEESPQFSATDRATITEALWELTHRFSYAGAVAQDSPIPRGNDTSARVAVDMARYWMKYYHVDAGGLWAWCNGTFRSQAKFWRPNEDCPGYGGSTMTDLLYWVLPSHYDTYWQDGTGRKLGDYGMAVMNNIGGHAGFGDTSTWMNPGHWPAILRAAAWKLQDGRYLYAEQHVARSTEGFFHNTYSQDQLQPQKPEDIMGIHVIPLPDWVYDHRNGLLGTAPSFMNPVLNGIPAPPREQCFDKITFRTSMEPDDQYLILDGISHGYHAHADGNSIIEFTDNGRYCLFDSGYFVPDTIEHNTLVIFRDGLFEPVPRLTGLSALGDLDRIGMTQTYLNGYNGANWRRNIIWNKERYFLVIDEVEAVEPGDYSLLAVFRTISQGKPEVDTDRVRATYKNRAFNIVSNSYAQIKLAGTLPPVGERHAIMQNLTPQLQRGEVARFMNLLYADDAEGWKYDMVPADDAAVMIKSPQGYALAGVGPARAIAGVELDATHFHVASDGFALTAGRALTVGEVSFTADRPVNIEINLGAAARGIIETAQATVLRLPAVGDTVQLDGRSTPVRSVPGGAELTVGPGKHRLAFRPVAERLPLPSWDALYEQLSRRHQQRLAQVQGPATGRPLQPAWQLENLTTDNKGNTVPAAVKAMVAKDLNGDGRDEVIALAASSVKCINAEGQIVWEHALEGAQALSMDAYDLDGDGHPEVVVGGNDAKLYCFDYQGNLAWSVLTPADRAYPEREPIHGRVEVVGCADINGDGLGEIVIGSGFGCPGEGGINWHAYGFDHTGKLLWTALNWAHVPTSISFVPMGDGKLASLISTTYSAANLFGPDGTKIGIVGCGFHGAAMTTAAGDMDGDGVPELLAGSRVGGIHCARPNDPPGITSGGFYGREGHEAPNEELWAKFLGAEVTKIALGDLTGDGKLELVGGSKNFHIVALDASGRVLWTRNVGEGVLDLVLGDTDGDGRPEVIAGTQAGRVLLLDAAGQVLGSFEAGGNVKPLALADLNGDGKLQILAGNDAGLIYGDIK